MPTFYMATPFTGLRITCSDTDLLAIDFVDNVNETDKADSELARAVQAQIRAYCHSASDAFDLPLRPGGTAFQQKVWRAMLAIPAGQVRTYGEIARELHSSARAVGNACRANPIPLVIPCHRVVSASGIGGYSGATEGERLALKRHLLAHEGVEI